MPVLLSINFLELTDFQISSTSRPSSELVSKVTIPQMQFTIKLSEDNLTFPKLFLDLYGWLQKKVKPKHVWLH